MFAAMILATTLAAAEPPITAAAFAPDGKVVVGSQAGLRLLTFPPLKPARTWKDAPEMIQDVVFAPSNEMLAVAGGSPAEKGFVDLLRWPAGERTMRLEGHTDVVQAIAFSQEGNRLVAASVDGTCRIFEVKTGKTLTTFAGHAGSVNAVLFMPDGKLILSGGNDASLRLWDATTGKAIRAIDNHIDAVHSLALRPGQPREAVPVVASGSADRTVRLWQPTTGRMMRFKRLPARVFAVAWTADGSRLVVGGSDGKVRVLDPDTLEIVQEKEAVSGWLYTIAVAAKGNAILVGGEKGQLGRIELDGKR